MRAALALARRGFGKTSPNPMVGAVLVKNGAIIGRGWHHRAGLPHAEIEALRDAERQAGSSRARKIIRGATLYVTLEPCSTHGRTPPCTNAIIAAGIARVVASAQDPNPAHRGKGFEILKRAGIAVDAAILSGESERLNEAFNHWITQRTPFVIVKSAMTLDGRIATSAGESKWITGETSRRHALKLRAGSDGVLVGVNTIIADDPSLTPRLPGFAGKPFRRVILDPRARIPTGSKVLNDSSARLTTVVVTKAASQSRVTKIERRANVLVAPARNGVIDLRWLLKKLGGENLTQLLVEGGGETNASFLSQGLAQRVAFFYAPLVFGGENAPRVVGGAGLRDGLDKISLRDAEWRKFGRDLFLTARVMETAEF